MTSTTLIDTFVKHFYFSGSSLLITTKYNTAKNVRGNSTQDAMRGNPLPEEVDEGVSSVSIRRDCRQPP